MTQPDRRALVRAAADVADGSPIAWAETATSDLDFHTLLQSLQAVESIAAIHRTLQGVEGEVEDSDSPPSGADLSSAWSWGRLRVLELLGSGGFGDVYRAYDSSLGRDVALKLLRSRAGLHGRTEEDVLAEARRLARLRHPNVLAVHGAGVHEQRAGFWTDLVMGETLEDHLARRGVLGSREAALVGIDLCGALAALHGAGLVHRDVKPANVMREEGGRIVLMDLGAAGEVSTDGDASSQGTPVAMAPEQLCGGRIGPWTDIYGLGALLYRLTSGQYPLSRRMVADALVEGAVPAARPLRDLRPDLPSEFVAVVERALEPDTSRRYASVGEMENALRIALGTAERPGQLPAPRRAKRLLLGAVAVLAVAALVITVVSRSPLRPSHPAGGHERVESGTRDRGTLAAAAPAGDRTAAPLTASATLYRHRGGVRRTLIAGDRIAPGDGLSLTISSAEPVYAYVLDEDEEGRDFVLFPLRGTEPQNPLPEGTPHRLPGMIGGESFEWQVTSAGGREVVTVIAARRPLAGLEAALALVPSATPGAPVTYRAVPPAAEEALRGIGGARPEEPVTSKRPHLHLSDALRQLPAESRDASQLWIWQVDLRNPAR